MFDFRAHEAGAPMPMVTRFLEVQHAARQVSHELTTERHKGEKINVCAAPHPESAASMMLGLGGASLAALFYTALKVGVAGYAGHGLLPKQGMTRGYEQLAD